MAKLGPYELNTIVSKKQIKITELAPTPEDKLYQQCIELYKNILCLAFGLSYIPEQKPGDEDRS
jgi:hypothetical protein